MRVLSHLDPTVYPLFLPPCFTQTFPIDFIRLNTDPFASETGFPFQSLRFAVVYSLVHPLPQSFCMRASHSRVVTRACALSDPDADGQFFSGFFTADCDSPPPAKRFLAVRTADCLPVLLAFENADLFLGAAIHAGWRGLSAGILREGLFALRQEAARLAVSGDVFLKNVRVHIGPAIFGPSYECQDAVRESLQRHLHGFNDSSREKTELLTALADLGQGKKSFFPDLQLLASVELTILGVLQENIEILRENTYSHPTLFSFRRATHQGKTLSCHQWTHLKLPVSGACPEK